MVQPAAPNKPAALTQQRRGLGHPADDPSDAVWHWPELTGCCCMDEHQQDPGRPQPHPSSPQHPWLEQCVPTGAADS